MMAHRMFSAAASLSREQIEERVLGVLRAFDRVNKDKVFPRIFILPPTLHVD